MDPRVVSYEKALKEVIVGANQILSGDVLRNYSHQNAQALLASFQIARAGSHLTLELLDHNLQSIASCSTGQW